MHNAAQRHMPSAENTTVCQDYNELVAIKFNLHRLEPNEPWSVSRAEQKLSQLVV